MENTCESCLTTFPELKVIISQFKCGICYEFMKTPMTTICGHSYCSVCIRTWISTRPLCPTCQTEVRDESLRNNFALENCIDPYTSLQNKLHDFCKTGVFKNFKPCEKSIQPPEHQDSERKHHNGDIRTESNHMAEIKKTPENYTAATRQGSEPKILQSPAKIPAVFLTSPKSKNQNQYKSKTDIFNSPTSSSSSRVQNDFGSPSTQSTNVNKVPCPVCSVQIPERNINIHLDKCLTIGSNEAASSPRKPEVERRQPLKKMVYHMMSDKEIRKKLQDFGLSTKGNRAQISNRLQRFTVLYNSECDSLHPCPVANIRKRVEKEEESLLKLAPPQSSKIFRPSKNADATEIEEINKQYITEHKSHFDHLIHQVRERQKKTKKKTEEGGPSSDSSTPKRGTTTERKSEDDEQPNVTWAGTASKRNRISDDDSDEFSYSKETSKSRRIDDSDDDYFLPRSKENSQETADAAAEISNASQNHREEKISPILFNEYNISSSSDDSLPVASPVLSRSPNENPNPMKVMPNRQRAQREVKKVKVPPVEDRRPTRGQRAKPEQLNFSLRRGRSKQQVEPVRTVSRTPSLSPSRLEGLGEDDRGSSVTQRRRASPEGESENENLSQLVDLLNETCYSPSDSQDY